MTGAMSATSYGALRRAVPLDARTARDRFLRAVSASPYVSRIAESVVMSVAAVALLTGPMRLVAALAVVVRALRTPTPRLTIRPLDGLARGIVDLAALFGATAAIGGAATLDQAGAWAATVAVGLGAGVVVETGRMLCRRCTTPGRLRVAVVSARGRAESASATMRGHRRLGLDPVPVELAVTRRAADAVDLVEAEVDSLGADAVVVVGEGLPRTVVGSLVVGIGERRPLFLVNTHGALGFGGAVETMWTERLVPAPVPAMQRPAWIVFAGVQRVVAAAALVVLAPLLGVLAAGVRLTSPGPVLFRQDRVGLRGEVFTLFKFRSMPVDHDSGAGWNAASRAEPTRLGRVMRDLSLDELPQLLNVVRGEMCLVGPRPELPRFVRVFEDHVPGYRDRHRVPAGLTGWAQIHGLRGDTSIVDRARFDNNYIDDWSVGRDLFVLLGTAAQLLPARFRPSPPVDDDAPIDLRVDPGVDLRPERPERRGRVTSEARMEPQAARVS